MDFTRTLHPIAPLTLALLLPACVIDTKLIDNPSTSGADTSATATTDDGATSVTEGDDTAITLEFMTSAAEGDSGATDPATTAPDDTSTTADTADTDDTDDECALVDTFFEWSIITNADASWFAPLDETCTVVSSAPDGMGLKFTLDCPQHAVMHGMFELVLYSGPMPVLVPQPGDPLEVYYQPKVEDEINGPSPELLFLRSEGELLYAAALGFFLDPNDEAIAAERQAPLTVDVEPGPCPLLDNPFAPEGAGDGFICKREAHALVRVTSPDQDDILLAEFDELEISAGLRSYTTRVLLARHGEDCVDLDLEKFAYTLALTTAP